MTLKEWMDWGLELAKAITSAWPLAVILCVLLLRKQVSNFLEKINNLTFKTKALEVVLSTFALEASSLSPAQKKELKNLTSSEIWALETFHLHHIKVNDMNPAQRVAASTLKMLDLIKIESDDHIKLTANGVKLLNIASEMPIN